MAGSGAGPATGAAHHCAKLTWPLLTHFLRDKNFRRWPRSRRRPSLKLLLLYLSVLLLQPP